MARFALAALLVFVAALLNSVSSSGANNYDEPLGEDILSQFTQLFKDEARLFEEFIDRYQKTYKHDLIEKSDRFKKFQKNLRKIEMLNRFEQGSAVYGINELADVSSDEFKQRLGLRPKRKENRGIEGALGSSIPDSKYYHDHYFDTPTNFDWRDTSGVVSKVKNQGSCGSCWAFSTTGNVEGVWAVKKNESVSLSEQELVDCDKIDKGCDGGTMDDAFATIIKMGGIESESDYPYEGIQGQCHADPSKVRVTISSSLDMPHNETYMKNYLYANGPMAVGLNANAMQFYLGGISHPPKFLCDPKNIDHGILIVAFAVGKTRFLHQIQPYWIIKNSWGSGWGEKGYYRLYRGDDSCGVSQMASSAVV